MCKSSYRCLIDRDDDLHADVHAWNSARRIIDTRKRIAQCGFQPLSFDQAQCVRITAVDRKLDFDAVPFRSSNKRPTAQ